MNRMLTIITCLVLTTPIAGCRVPADAGADITDAVAVLNTLQVRVEDTGAHYDRSQWGGWTGQGAGCDTRATVLIRQGHDVHQGRSCRPMCPVGKCWTSPYDGVSTSNPSEIQIDHRVPVKEANRSGARDWDTTRRARFYNDQANLVAVSAHSNTSKGDKDPGRWRPTNRAAWCDYATGYVATKRTYGLSIDQPEHDSLLAMLRTCARKAAQ